MALGLTVGRSGYAQFPGTNFQDLEDGTHIQGDGGYDVHGAWVEFVIPFYNELGTDGYVKEGHLFRIVGGYKEEIAKITCNKQTESPYYATISSQNSSVLAALDETTVAKDVDITQWNFVGHNALVSVNDAVGENGNSILYIRWYVPGNLTDNDITFQYVATLQSAGPITSVFDTTFVKSSKFSPIPDANLSWDFSDEPGKIDVQYAYTEDFNPLLDVNHEIDNQTIHEEENEKPSGKVSVDMRNLQRTLNFHTQALTDNFDIRYAKSELIKVPAYVWPDSLSAKYDGKDSVTLSWKVDSLSGLKGIDYVAGKFEVARSTDSAFSGIEPIETILMPDYDPDKKTYTIHDNLSGLSGSSHLYYRLRRTETKDKWGWNEYRGAEVNIDMNTTQVADTVILQNTDDGPQAIIIWEPFRGVWTDNTKFYLKKNNKTNGTLAATVDIDEAMARSGKYIDKNIQYCNEFAYTIALTLGNGFTSPPETPVPGSVLAVNIGTITNLTASKGYFPDRVELQWHSQGSFDNYIVKRKIYGSSENYIQIANIQGSSTTDLQTDDSKGSPGVYYEYIIVGAIECNGELRYSQVTDSAIGYRSPTGNIYGRVTYSNGQAVENAAIRLQNNDNTQLGQSIYLEENAGSYLKIDSLNTPFEDSAFTIEAWIRPDDATPKSQVIFNRSGQYELGFDAAGKLYFSYNGISVSGDYFNQNQAYVHVAGIHTTDSILLMINDSLIATRAASFTHSSNVDKGAYIGRNVTGNNFKGYIDEMRVWNIALSPMRIARDYTLLLTGGEKGLAAYWRFDETITDQFYDISHHADTYNRNDGIMNPSFVRHKSFIPDDYQLSLKAYTDSSGNYLISGIPYSGQGTTYTIVPLLGTHKFNPVSVNRLISASSSSFSIDFIDESSFPVTGNVYYANSTIPVPDVEFLIDGKYAQQSNGTLLQSGDDGKFTISVPVGIHEVKAVKNNHVFQLGGRILDRHLHDLNYQAPEGPFTLYDSTTIRFIGRVAGGAVQEAFPLGNSLSTNNLGKQLAITLILPNAAYNLYDGNDADSIIIVNHLLPANETDSSHPHKTRVVWKQKEIVIYPDSLTGEFEADLIPEKFNVQSVTATGWGNIWEGKSFSLDFSNKFITQYSIYSYTDSVQNSQGSWDLGSYTDSVAYNDSYQFINRVTPTLSITQVDEKGEGMSYFGDTAYAYSSLGGTNDTISVIDQAKSGQSKYLFSHPVFRQNKSYHFKVEAFESYPFYESTDQDGNGIIAQSPDGKPIMDKVSTQDGFVSLLNTIREGPTQADTLSLDSTGTGYYDFTAGYPAILFPGLKDFSASMEYGEASQVSWNWLGNPKMQVFNMGEKLSGTDFITAGPNEIMMVLRDPPGNRSYSFAEQGSTISSATSYTGTVDNINDASAVAHLGAKVITWQGIGAGVIQENEVIADVGTSVHLEEHYTHNDTKVSSITLTSRFQTSDAPTFVGSIADLYVGHSTNITYGKSDNLIIIKRDDLKSTDSLIYQSSPSSFYLIVGRQGVNFGEKFGTLFAYPQQHIVKVLIPNLVNIRNNLLLLSTTTPAEAQLMADNTNQQVYVSKLSPHDPDFGKSNTDSIAFGEKAKALFGDGASYKIYFPTGSEYHTDTIMTLNQYMTGWEEVIADNEEAKLNSEKIQNYSFHAGNPISYSKQTALSQTKTNSFNIIVSGNWLAEAGGTLMGIGMTLKNSITIGTNQGGSSENAEASQSTIGFELAAEGVGEYISVDVNRTNEDGLAFRTKGGETECPYEGIDTTKYYKPGTVLGLPTAQMDKPNITVENPVISNVPATQKASYTLHLTNVSEAAWSTNFVLSYGNTDSVKGATIAVEGLPLAGGITYPSVYGQPITKVLTIAKGPDAMDYNNIPIILHSGCQYDPTGYQALIADTVLVSAHFVPSCSDIHVKSPADNWILNTSSPAETESGKRYLPITLDQFDMNNSLFDRIDLQYKPSGSSGWTTVMSFYGDSAKYKAAEGEKSFIANASGIDYNLEMNDAAFSDQRYDIRALAVCQLGPNNYINTPSNVVSGIKDTYTPRLFGNPEPGNGVLRTGDDIRVNFNEPIAAGLLTQTDFRVTGIRNGTQGDHSVSVDLDGENDYIETEFKKNISDRDITAEMWVLPDGIENGTVFSHGNINESLELSFTDDNHLQVTIGKKKITSSQTLDYQPGQWAHIALVYNAEDSTVSAFYNFQAVIHQVAVPAYHGIGTFRFGSSISEAGNFFAGKMHEARIWSYNLPATTLQINSLTRFSGGEDGLMAYYPMTEGQGSTIFDKAHGNNATLTGTWSTPPGKAIEFSGAGYVKLETATAPITPDMDYTLGLWFNANSDQSNAALASNGKGDGTDPGPTGSRNLFFLGFENGQLTFKNNGIKVQADGNYLDNSWHHVAVAVNRTDGIARLYLDGVLKKYFNAKSLGGIAAANTYLGARAYRTDTNQVTPTFDRYLKGKTDEFRLWNTYLNQSLIDKNGNIRLQGDELGLMAYYPFDKYYPSQGQQEMDTTLYDQKLAPDPDITAPHAKLVNAISTGDMAPVKDRGPVTNLNFDYVVNNDALIINLLEPRQAVDKTIVTFQVEGALDMQGNTLASPVTWTAYIDQNPLKWSDDELNLSKDVYKPGQFESYIINSGGSNEHFILDNLPGWLTADITSGTVSPEGKQKITFTIDEGLNVGSYNEIVYMRNDNGETESLEVNVKVSGEMPDWKVNPADFKYNMTVYGKIRIDNIFSDDTGDMLAAFANGKCVGLAHNTHFAGQDLWYAFLTVYSDSLHADNLEFRIWDAGTGKIYEGIPSEPVAFVNNGVAGNPDTPIIFDGKESLFRNIDLVKGWNWLSFDLASNQLEDVNAALGNGSWQSGDIMKHDERGFDEYSIGNGWVGTLSGFDNTSLFKLMTTNGQTLSISGTLTDVKKVPITIRGSRWNYISYLPQVNMTLKEALANYEASSGDEIKSQTGFSMYSEQKGWVGNLTYLEPGKGYMLYRNVSDNTQFVYPDISGSLTVHRLAENTGSFERLNPYQSPVPSNFSFADNMTVVAAVSNGFTMMPGDKVRAYADTELRAAAGSMENDVVGTPVFLFNISGKNDQFVHFEVERNGKVAAKTDPVMRYMSNRMIGSLKEPLMLHFDKPTVETGIFPNPFHNKVTVHVTLASGLHQLQMSVYDVNGRLITSYVKESTDGKYYEATWNGNNDNGIPCSAGIYFIHLLVDGKPHVYKVMKY